MDNLFYHVRLSKYIGVSKMRMDSIHKLLNRATALLLLLLISISSLHLTGVIEGLPNEEYHEINFDDHDKVTIRMKSAVFDPLKKGIEHVNLNEPGINYYLIQFSDSMESEWFTTMASAGVDIYEYIPDNTYLVKVDDGASNINSRDLKSLPIRWVGRYLPDYKIHPALVSNEDEIIDITVLIFNDEAAKTSLEYIERRMDSLYTIWSRRFYIGISGSIHSSYINGVAGLNNLYWMEPHSPMLLLDEVSSEIVGGNWTAGEPWGGPGSYVNSLGYDGEGVRVAVADTGIDGGEGAVTHPDLKVTDFFDYTSAGGATDGHAHGTHCAGIVAGDGTTGRKDEDGYLYGMGAAPAAELVAQKIFDDEGGWGYPSYSTLMSDAYSAGAYVSSNSWGGVSGGEYNIVCAEYDALVRDTMPGEEGEQPMITVFAAGNSGSAPYTISFPGLAKNVIAVGASENYRPDKGTNADDIDDMAYFSSRGPTSDGRIKPDIVAPGTWISSTRSSAATNTLWGAIDEYYLWSGGTSMAAPHVAGGSAIFTQYYQEEYGVQPSPAMTKGALLMGANDMSASRIPAFDQGWGRLNLTNAVQPQGIFNHEDQEEGLTTGESVSRKIYIGDTQQPLKVVLSWTDPPASPAALIALVNDLDLTVTGPDGRIFRGNQFVDGWSDSYSLERDDRNNIEAVYISPSDLRLGEYVITVNAVNVAMDVVPDTPEIQQDYALVASYMPPSSEGKIGFDRDVYNTDSEPLITLVDTDLSTDPDEKDTSVVNITSLLTGDCEEVILTELGESLGVFTGRIELQLEANSTKNNSILEVKDNDWINVTFSEKEHEVKASARIDVTPPEISNVSSIERPHSRVEISWETDEPSTSRVVYGRTVPPDKEIENIRYTTEHTIIIPNLKELSSYHYFVESTDAPGNTGRDDNDGKYHVFFVPKTPTILLVDDDNSLNNDGPYERRCVEEPSGVTYYSDALISAGYDFATYVVPSRGSGPPLEIMDGYDVILWVTGYNGFYHTVESTLTVWDMENLAAYLDGGGALWLVGPLVGNDLYGSGASELSDDDFLHEYMGVSKTYSNLEPTATPTKGVFGTFMGGFQGYVETHWRYEDKREDYAYELKPKEDAFGVVEGDGITYPYHGIAYETYDYRTVFFAWEPSFTGSTTLTDTVKRVISWLVQPPVSVHLSPPHQIGYGIPGETVEYSLTVFNDGINGADTFDIYAEDTDWDIQLTYRDGIPLTDTTGSGSTDTGRVSMGGSVEIIVSINIPQSAEKLDNSTLSFTVRSSLDPSLEATTSLDTIVSVIPPWDDNFETEPVGWTVNSDGWGTEWEWGVPGAGPGGAAVGDNCWGTNLNTNYYKNSESVLVSPPIYLENFNTAVLSFQSWYNTEIYNDGGFVEASTDGGDTWQRIEPEAGYNFTNGNFGGLGGDGYSGYGGEWTTEYFDLTGSIGGTIILRWRFSSGRGVTRSGWYIDDVNMYVSQAGIDLEKTTTGGSAGPGSNHTYTINIENTGDEHDTFNIEHNTYHGWETGFFDSAWNPLYDTNGNGFIDTGVVAPDETSTIFVNITVPSGTAVGDDPEMTTLWFNSSVDISLGADMVLYTYARADILLVDDDGGLGSRYWYTDALESAGYTYNIWTAIQQGPPCSAAMLAHDAVIWFTGNHRGITSPSGRDPLRERERKVITDYLEGGGSLYLSSQGAANVALESGYEDFMEEYFGFKVRNSITYFDNNWWILPNPAFGIADNPISDMLEFELCRYGEYFEGLDKRGVFGEVAGEGEEVLRMREGLTVATSVDNGFRTVYTGFDFASVAAPENREELMKRIIAWLSPRTEDVTVYPKVVKEASSGSTAEHLIRVRNQGSTANNFELSVQSEFNWTVEFYHKDGTGPILETGIIYPEDYTDLYIKVQIPGDVDEPGLSVDMTVKATSMNDTDVDDSLVLQLLIPQSGVACSPDEKKIIGSEGENIDITLEVFNKGGLNDTINMYYSSVYGWEHHFYHTETGIPLNDTVGDGLVDTGELPGLSSVPITLNVQIPEGEIGGATDLGSIHIISWRNNSKTFTSSLRIYVPVKPNWTDDMEHGSGGWVAEDNDFGTHWESGDPTIYEYGPDYTPSGDNCWGTNIHSNYTRTGEATLTSPLMDLRGATEANASFSHWYSIWGDDPGNSRADGGYLEISLDLGESWKYVIPEEGYNETIHQSVGIGWCYGQNSNGWLKGSVNLTEYVDNYVLLRFHFWGRTPGPMTRWAGWYIDDFNLNATFRSVALESFIDRESNYCSSEGSAYYNLTVTNLGQQEDIFEFSVEESDWSFNFYNDTWAPLNDTGNIPVQETMKIILEVVPPTGTTQGEYDENIITIFSHNDSNVSREFNIHTMVPLNSPYYNDMEEGKGAWSHYWISGEGIDDNWKISENRSYSGNHSWWSGSEIATWVNGGDTTLETPFFDFTGADEELEMTFWHWYSFESSRYSVMDGGIVEIWDNKSGAWRQIYPEGGYDRVLNLLTHNPLGGREAFVYTGTFPQWNRENFDISPYIGLTVKFRFRVGWNLGERGIKEGWYIDCFHIGSPLPDVDVRSDATDDYTLPGETTSYGLTIKNTGKVSETFDLAWSAQSNSTVEFFDSSWGPISETGVLDPNDHFTVYANVTLSENMDLENFETIEIIVSSASNLLIQDISEISLGIPVSGPYHNDFSDDAPGWSHTRLEGIIVEDNWQMTSDKYHVGGTSWWSGPEDGGWPTGGTTALLSPYIDTNDMNTDIELSFWHRYDFGSNFEGPGDGSVVEIWDDETEAWHRLYPERGYPVEISRRHGNPLEGCKAFGEMSHGWKYEIYDLSSYHGKVIRIRFVVSWDSVIEEKEGWFVDDFRVYSVDELVVDMKTGTPFYVDQGQKNIVIGQLNLSTRNSDTPMDRLELYLSGSGRDSDVESVLLYHDVNSDGDLDPEQDIYLGSGIFNMKRANFEDLDFTVFPGYTYSLLIVFNISSHAPAGIRLGVKFLDAEQFVVALPNRVEDFKEMQSSSVIVQGDDINPTILFTNPSHGATSVGIQPSVTVEFEKPMNTLSVERGITLYQSDHLWDHLSFTLSWNPNHTEFTLIPSISLDKNTTYTIDLNASYLKDLYENFLDGNGNGIFEGHPIDTYSWSFTTVTPQEYDIFPPHVVHTIPYNGSVGNSLDTDVVVVFNETMNTNHEPSLQLPQGTDPGGWDFVGWSDTYTANDTATWSHHPLKKGTKIILEVMEYMDLAGNEGEPYSWSFWTLFTPYDSPWPVFKCDMRRTGQSPYDTSWNPGQLEWSFKTLGNLSMQPVIGTDGTIYLGDDEGYIYAVSPQGESLWRFRLSQDSLLTSPAIGLDGTVYISSFDGNIYALAPDGTAKWNFTTGGPLYSSPVIGEDGTVYVGSYDNYVYALKRDGSLKWKFETGGPIASSLAMDNGILYTYSFDGMLYALDIYGNLKWIYDTGLYEWSYHSPAVNENGTVYFGLSTSEKSVLYSVDHAGTLLNNVSLDGKICTSPSISHQGTVYIGVCNAQEGGYLYALDTDGTVKWKYQVSNMVSDITISGDGTIYVGSSDLHAVNRDGTKIWASKSSDLLSKEYFGSPIISFDGTIYVTYSTGFLYAIGYDTVSPTSRGDPNNILERYSNDRNIKIPFTADDNHRLSLIELYYRKDGGPWTFSNISKSIWGSSYTGMINFTAMEDGHYEFFTTAVDVAGNRENKTALTEAKTTIDTKPPSIIRIHPPPGSAGVRIDMPLEITFDEPVSPSSVQFTIERERGVVIGSWELSSDGKTLVFTPLIDLEHNITYTVTLSAADNAGNYVEKKWNFTTDVPVIEEVERDPFFVVVILIILLCFVAVLHGRKKPVKQKRKRKVKPLEDYEGEFFGR